MIIVSNTTPLNYLVLIDAIDVLGKLFQEVWTTRAVLNELLHPKAPDAVRAWAASPPPWLRLHDLRHLLPSTARLDSGEAEAISLAKQRHIPEIILDDRRATMVALQEDLRPIHTLAILQVAAERNLIDLSQAIERLRCTTIRIAPKYYSAALAHDVKRKAELPPIPPGQ